MVERSSPESAVLAYISEWSRIIWHATRDQTKVDRAIMLADLNGMFDPVRFAAFGHAQTQAEPREIQERAANAIRTFCRSLSPAAVQTAGGVERIYYAGISLDALSVAVALALSDTRPDRKSEL